EGLTPRLSELLPVKTSGTRSLATLQGLADLVATPITPTGSVLAADAALRTEPLLQARTLASQDGLPLVAIRTFGEGQVAYLALSPGLAPLKTWDGLVPLFQRLLAEHKPGGTSQ